MPTSYSEVVQIELFYTSWTEFLKDNELYFIKPDKQVFPQNQQIELQQAIYKAILDQISQVKGVDKIYLMGSITRQQLGLYEKPFVHGRWAKLASDVDILIEMQESYEFPESWKFVNSSSSNSCDIYHCFEYIMQDIKGFQIEFEYIDFFHHLIDAYVYIPGKSDFNRKEAFKEKFSAQLLYSTNPNDLPDILLTDDEMDDPWLTASDEDIPDPWAENNQQDIELTEKKTLKI